MIVASICLTDIPKDRVTTSDKNGKKYIQIVIDEKKSPDNFGNTHSIALSQTKEERTARTPKTYVGNGKQYAGGNNNGMPQPQSQYNGSNADYSKDDLPF